MVLDRVSRLKHLLDKGDIIVAPGIYDGFSAHLVEKMGFEVAFISGAGLSESRLGRPDVGIMGLEENLQGTRALAASTNLSLIADGDTGYGNAVNVFYAVRAFEQTGIACLMLEDKEWPMRCGHFMGKEVISEKEMVKKIEAAVDARNNPDFLIKARTDAAGVLGIDEAIRRANIYHDAGADLLFAEALPSKDDIRRFASEVKGKVCVSMGFGMRSGGKTPSISPKELKSMGVAIVEYPRLFTSAALRGMMNAMDVLKDTISKGKAIERPDIMVSFDELNDLNGFKIVKTMDAKYAVNENEPISR